MPEREADLFALQLAALSDRDPQTLLDHLRGRPGDDTHAAQRLRWLLSSAGA
ncbi:MAG: hypothetical protein ACOCYP_04720 [Planctomycetota bacterium]